MPKSGDRPSRLVNPGYLLRCTIIESTPTTPEYNDCSRGQVNKADYVKDCVS